MEVIKLLWSCIDNRSSTSSSMRVFQPFAYPAASYCVSSYETEWNNHRCFINCNLEELSMSSRCYQSRWPEAIAASYRGTDIVSENWSMISSTKNWNDIVEARKAAGEWSEGTAKDWSHPDYLESSPSTRISDTGPPAINSGVCLMKRSNLAVVFEMWLDRQVLSERQGTNGEGQFLAGNLSSPAKHSKKPSIYRV